MKLKYDIDIEKNQQFKTFHSNSLSLVVGHYWQL